MVVILEHVTNYFFASIEKFFIIFSHFFGVVKGLMDWKISVFFIDFFFDFSINIEICWFLFDIQMLDILFLSINVYNL